MAKINWFIDDKCVECHGTGFYEITTWKDGSDSYSVVDQRFRAVCNCIIVAPVDLSDKIKW